MKVMINGKEAVVGNLSREASEDNLGQTLSFEAIELYSVGDKVKVYEDGVKFSGMIIEVNEEHLPPHSYRVVDYAFNLQSEDHIQIKDRADNAIKNICRKFGISCNVCSIPTKIRKIYPDMAISEIFKDILKISGKEQGKSYYMEVDCGKLVIEEKEKIKIKDGYLISANNALTSSIEELRNSIKVVSSSGAAKIYATEKDTKSVKKFGLLQSVEALDDDKLSKASMLAQNQLAKLNRTKYTFPVQLFVYERAWDIKPNRLLYINTPQKKGWYKIHSLTHTMEDGIDFIDATLEWKK